MEKSRIVVHLHIAVARLLRKTLRKNFAEKQSVLPLIFLISVMKLGVTRTSKPFC